MIVLEQVSKGFGGRAVIDRLDWRIGMGERWQITGASGVGKTTLLRLLMGLEKPDSGRITGTDGVRFCPVFQEDRLVEGWSAEANVSLVCGDAARAREILCALLPEDALRQRVHTLSGGMRRRVALARALAAEGDVLVLDEPFAGLDSGTAQRALAVTEQHRAGRAVLLVSHGGGRRLSGWMALQLDGKSAIL